MHTAQVFLLLATLGLQILVDSRPFHTNDTRTIVCLALNCPEIDRPLILPRGVTKPPKPVKPTPGEEDPSIPGGSRDPNPVDGSTSRNPNTVLPFQNYVDRGQAVKNRLRDLKIDQADDRAEVDTTLGYKVATDEEGVSETINFAPSIRGERYTSEEYSASFRVMKKDPQLVQFDDFIWCTNKETDGSPVINISGYSGEDGIIVTKEMISANDPLVNGDLQYLQQSELMYKAWQEATGAAGRNVDSLNFNIQKHIVNAGTEDIIKKVYTGDKKTPQTFTDNDADISEKKAFMALLGSDNGRPVQFMLNDHRKAFNNLEITKITIVPRPTDGFDLVHTISRP